MIKKKITGGDNKNKDENNSLIGELEKTGGGADNEA